MSWFLLGFAFALAQFPLYNLKQSHFTKTEPFYGAPVSAGSGQPLYLRRDSYGKGFYGASRNGGRTHQGLDIVAPVGGKILASKSGRVVSAFEEKGYGRWIEIRHPDGLRTRYAHLSLMFVKKGDWVRAGEVIGAGGKSGNAVNPRIKSHLHFEIRDANGALNPTSGLLEPSLILINQ